MRGIFLLAAIVLSSYHEGFCHGIKMPTDRLKEIRRRMNLHVKHAIKTIESEDGEVIDCVGLYKQPAFDHPDLKDHKIQMMPSGVSTTNSKPTTPENEVRQVWQKYGSCPEGTIPIRRVDESALLNSNSSVKHYGRKSGSGVHGQLKLETNTSNLAYPDTSVVILLTASLSYTRGKAEMNVWNPYVDKDDEYSLSYIAVRNSYFESVQSGWAVHPGVYGDRATHFFVYWMGDRARQGCFDLTCPGFVQISRRIALGGALDLNNIPIPGGLGGVLTLWIEKDVITGNWWVRTGANQENVGYFPANLFSGLQHTADIVEWGGEVHSKHVGNVRPHTSTAMGNGEFGDAIAMCGKMKIIRIRTNDPVWVIPGWIAVHIDEWECYRGEYLKISEPEYSFGGPGRNPRCP
uniref:Neprosin PEP catalytic domain-containing protein n=1 Tax=Kalanchoe fedtschenkoi TaxID=63787 RepID=A0A7N1A578_KALFE